MNPIVRTVLALLFVAAVAIVLTIPLRGTESGSGPDPRVASPSVLPSPSRTSLRFTLRPGSFPRSKRFAARFPRTCLRPAQPPAGDGLVAVVGRGRVAIASLGGEEVASFRSRPPVAVSPSGGFVAAGPQGLMWTTDGESIAAANGEFQHGFVWQAKRGAWAWSPISDCGLSAERGQLLVSSADPQETSLGVTLLTRKVEAFAFSPDGRELGILTREAGPRSPASIWIADLTRSRMEEVRRFRRATCCITLGGWSPDGQHLFYWAASGNSVAADGWPLTSVTAAGARGNWGPTLTRPTVLEVCGDRLVGLTGGDRFQQGNRIAVLERGRQPRSLTARGSYGSLTCARSGALIAASRSGRMVLFDGSGNFVRNLTTIATGNGELTELSPDWGPPGTGILFIRQIHDTRQLWFLGEGAAAPNVVADVVLTGTHPLGTLFDWSATPPAGLAN